MWWDISCYVFGAISVVGPICLIFWYGAEAKRRIADLNKK